MKTYIFHNTKGKILRTETREMSFDYKESHIALEGKVEVDYEKQKIVKGKLLNKTPTEISTEQENNLLEIAAKAKSALLAIRPKYLAAKNESPAVMEYLKEIGVISPNIDDLIK